MRTALGAAFVFGFGLHAANAQISVSPESFAFCNKQWRDYRDGNSSASDNEFASYVKACYAKYNQEHGQGKPRSAESLECSKQADAQGLHGKERAAFRSQCMAAAQVPAAQPATAVPIALSQEVSLSYVTNTTPPDAYLSLRSVPSKTGGQRIMAMPNGTRLKVINKQPDGWWYVQVVPGGQTGWALSGEADKKWIECCTIATAELPKGQGATLAAAAPANSNQPSFNCANAKSASARLICSDQELSRIDGLLGKLYRDTRAKMTPEMQKEFTASQLSWIKSRNTQCGLDGKAGAPTEELVPAAPCMKKAMETRIDDLSGRGPPSLGRQQNITSAGAPPVEGNEPVSAEEKRAAVNAIRGKLSSATGYKGDPIDVDIYLKPDGTLAAPPKIVSQPNNDPNYQAAVDNVLIAINQSQPFSMLRRESYANWKFLPMTIHPASKLTPADVSPAKAPEHLLAATACGGGADVERTYEALGLV